MNPSETVQGTALRQRVIGLGLLLLCVIQLAIAVPAFRAELTQLAVNARVAAWERTESVPTPAEFDRAYNELATAIRRTPGWGELYELRARLTMQAINDPEIALDSLDAVVASARADLDSAAARRPTLPRVPLIQLGLDSLMFLAGSEQYHRHAVTVFTLGTSSRIYLEPVLKVTLRDWRRLDPATRELTLTGLGDLATVSPASVANLLKGLPHRDEICALRDLGC